MILAQIIKSIFEIALVGAFIFSSIYFIITFISLSKKRLTKSASFLENSKALPFVTIQIPTFNELAALNCAQKCLEFNYPEEKLQILIGDDSNNKDISNTIDEFVKKIQK